MVCRTLSEGQIEGGHIILLNPEGRNIMRKQSGRHWKLCGLIRRECRSAEELLQKMLQKYLEEGASHVIVTSYVFQNGQVRYDRLDRLKKAVGKEHTGTWISAAGGARTVIIL